MLKQENWKIETINSKYAELLSNKELTPGIAISEFIDNSIQSIIDQFISEHSQKYQINDGSDVYDILEGDDENLKQKIIDELKKYNCQINITYWTEPQGEIKRFIQVTDNAFGIPEERIHNCMTRHDTKIQNLSGIKNSMNNYGVGMKDAIFFLGNNGILFTKTKNSDFIHVADYDAEPKEEKYNIDIQIKHSKIKLDELVSNNIIEYCKQDILSKNLDLLKEHGTSILITSVEQKYSNSLNPQTKKSYDKFLKTIGMKYSKYIENNVITIKLQNGEKGETQLIESWNFSQNKKDEEEPPCFVIKKWFEKNKESIQKSIILNENLITTVEEFQQYMKERLEDAKRDNPKFKEICDQNPNLLTIFDDIEKPIIFNLNILMKLKNREDQKLKIKVIILFKPNNPYSNVNTIAQWRYINMPCIEATTNQRLHQWILSENNWRDQQSCKWSCFEIFLRELPENKNFQNIEPCDNKQDIRETKESIDKYRETLEEKLKEIKINLLPFTDIFKNIRTSLNEEISDSLIEQHIHIINDNGNRFVKTKEQNIYIDDKNIIDDDQKIFYDDWDSKQGLYKRYFNKNNKFINFKNDNEETKIKLTIFYFTIIDKLFKQQKKISNWINNKLDCFSKIPDFQDIKDCLLNNDQSINDFMNMELDIKDEQK